MVASPEVVAERSVIHSDDATAIKSSRRRGRIVAEAQREDFGTHSAQTRIRL
jgi:hypothetical protein